MPDFLAIGIPFFALLLCALLAFLHAAIPDQGWKLNQRRQWWCNRVGDPRSFTEGVLAEQMVEYYENELNERGLEVWR